MPKLGSYFWVDLSPPPLRANISTDNSSIKFILLILYVHVCGYVGISQMWRSEYNLEELNHLTLLDYLLSVCRLLLELTICSHWPK